MGLPVSIGLGALFFAMPDATQMMLRGYQVYNGTWKWGFHPEGEVAIALQQGSTYLVMTPEKFINDFPEIFPSTTISPIITTTMNDDIPTPLDEFEEFLEVEAYDRVVNKFNLLKKRPLEDNKRVVKKIKV